MSAYSHQQDEVLITYWIPNSPDNLTVVPQNTGKYDTINVWRTEKGEEKMTPPMASPVLWEKEAVQRRGQAEPGAARRARGSAAQHGERRGRNQPPGVWAGTQRGEQLSKCAISKPKCFQKVQNTSANVAFFPL